MTRSRHSSGPSTGANKAMRYLGLFLAATIGLLFVGLSVAHAGHAQAYHDIATDVTQHGPIVVMFGMAFSGLSTNRLFTPSAIGEDISKIIATLAPVEAPLLDWLGDSNLVA